jgi:hypothetical protein
LIVALRHVEEDEALIVEIGHDGVAAELHDDRVLEAARAVDEDDGMFAPRGGKDPKVEGRRRSARPRRTAVDRDRDLAIERDRDDDAGVTAGARGQCEEKDSANPQKA